MCEDGFPALLWWNKFFIKQVENTNKIHGFGQFIFSFISLLGGHKLMRFVHRNRVPFVPSGARRDSKA